jgi:hypothetical protein
MPDRFRGEKVTYTGPVRYRIIIDGHVDDDLSDYLAGMKMETSLRDDGSAITTLTGRIVDQSQLNGVVNALYELHFPVLAVEALPVEES